MYSPGYKRTAHTTYVHARGKLCFPSTTHEGSAWLAEYVKGVANAIHSETVAGKFILFLRLHITCYLLLTGTEAS